MQHDIVASIDQFVLSYTLCEVDQGSMGHLEYFVKIQTNA